MELSTFTNLPDEKKQRIIDASIEEFSTYGFTGASTNRIVKKIGISKGSLFKYFKTKEDLYLYLLSYAGNKMVILVTEDVENMSKDILVRLRYITEVGLDFYIQHPKLYAFFMTFLDQGAAHLVKRFLENYADSVWIFRKMFQGIDTAQFRYDENTTLTLVRWLFAGIKTELSSQRQMIENPEELKKNFMSRLDLVLEALVNGIYKNQE